MSKIEIKEIILEEDDESLLEDITCGLPSELMTGRESLAVEWVEGVMQDIVLLPKSLLAIKNQSRSTGAVVKVSRPLMARCLYPETPLVYEPAEKADVNRFDVSHIAISSLVGVTYGNSDVRGGRIIADIFPKQGYEYAENTAFGSMEEFDFHADGATHPDIRPDYFALHCLRNLEKAETIVSKVSIGDFDDRTLEALMEPVYDLRYIKDSKYPAVEKVPIIEIDNSSLKINYYGLNKISVCRDIDDEGCYSEAIGKFNNALRKNSERIILESGDMLIVDNNFIQHARSSFEPHVEMGKRRWLRRVFLSNARHVLDMIGLSTDRVIKSHLAAKD